MKTRDRGAIRLPLLTLVAAAVIGGAATVGTAALLVNLAPSQTPMQLNTQLSGQELHYGDRGGNGDYTGGAGGGGR